MMEKMNAPGAVNNNAIPDNANVNVKTIVSTPTIGNYRHRIARPGDATLNLNMAAILRL